MERIEKIIKETFNENDSTVATKLLAKEAKRMDGTTKPFSKGDYVVYFPRHYKKFKGRTEMDEDLGIVSSKNNKYVFVEYLNKNHSQATNPKDLCFLFCRPDLIKRIIENKNPSITILKTETLL